MSTDDRHDAVRRFIAMIAKQMAERIDDQMMNDLKKGNCTLHLEIGPVSGPDKVVWTEDDEPMTEQMETFVRGRPSGVVTFTPPGDQCDCSACSKHREAEREGWTSIGIDIDGKEMT